MWVLKTENMGKGSGMRENKTCIVSPDPRVVEAGVSRKYRGSVWDSRILARSACCLCLEKGSLGVKSKRGCRDGVGWGVQGDREIVYLSALLYRVSAILTGRSRDEKAHLSNNSLSSQVQAVSVKGS